jgi:hypothetical protein
MAKNKLIEALEKEFEQIIQYHVNKGELHQRAEKEVRVFFDYLLNQTEYTKKRLIEVIEKINYETIKPDYNIWPSLEFWRGVDDYGSAIALTYDGGVDILDGEESVVIGRYENYKTPSDSEILKASKERNSIKIDLEKYPISLLGYYEYKFNETALFYSWIGYLWQEVEGHKCGIKVKTVQNNSIATYSLNDYLEDDFSSFVKSDYGEKPPRLGSFFQRKLNLIELYLRASQTSYPFNPFKNYWRYFEKGDEFIDIVTYEFSTGIRSGKKENRNSVLINQVIKHKNSSLALKHITEFSNQMIFDGWEEKLRPLDMPEKMHNNAYDFYIWTGVNWSEEQTNMLSEEKVKNFEEQFDIQLPKSFFHYLRLLNGRQYNSYHMFFPIDNLYTVEVKKFFNIEELENLANISLKKDSNHLWIGELENRKMLGIAINKESDNYGKIVIADNGTVDVCDYSFEKFAKYSQASPKQPEIFAAEENDAEFLRKRIKEGWDYNTIYSYQDAVTQAAENNAHEALEVLLEAGARLSYNNHRVMTYAYDEKTMEILDKYQKDE